MAQKKKRKHGKVEVRQQRARIRFKPGMRVVITLLTFGTCFGAYLVRASTTPGYWEDVIVANMHLDDGEPHTGKTGKRANVTNPVPSGDRADDSYMGEVAFIGEVAPLSTYYQTNPGMMFTDTLLDLAESRMRSIARSLYGSSPKAVYIWYPAPSDLEAGEDAVKALADSIWEQTPDMPIYILTAAPVTEIENSQKTETWNASLFAMADELGMHYVDVSTTLKANDGTLADAYRDNEENLIKTVGDQILTHVLPA